MLLDACKFNKALVRGCQEQAAVHCALATDGEGTPDCSEGVALTPHATRPPQAW